MLPVGLSLSASGVISGTPTAAPQSPNAPAPAFTVQATDSIGQSGSRFYYLPVRSPVVSITTASLPVGTVGVAYSATLTASGGTAPYYWNVTAGALPAGLSLAVSGVLSGTPTAPGSFSFTVQATDSAARQASKAFTVTVAPAAAPGTLTTGGLVSYPTRQSGPNLLANAGFEEASARPDKPLGWSDNGFFLDTTVAHSGRASFRLRDAQLIPYTQYAWQDILLEKGVYRIGGWVKKSNLAAVQASGVRLCLSVAAPLGGGCTAIVKGTGDWEYLARTSLVISQDTTARFQLASYGDPDGTAWFDDIEVRRDSLPLEVFLLYPNYRGVLFDDQTQTARFDLAVDPPAGTACADYQINGTVTDETTSTVVLQTSLPAAATAQADFNFSPLATGRTYLVAFRMVRIAGAVAVYDHPAYRIAKVAGALRASMTMAFDEQNRFMMRGQPAFLLGVYDSGLGYTTLEQGWENVLTSERRLFELPINLYLNYWYGAAPNNAMLAMLNVLQRHGIYGLTNANCFAGSTVEQVGAPWFLGSTDAVIQARGQHPGFAGFYVADECQACLAADVFGRYQRMKTLDPDGITLGTLVPGNDLFLWRDAVDVLATDSYPLNRAEPEDGYPLSKVADAARSTRDALKGSRPFITVLQFFHGTSDSRWPTQAELRNMSYAAIVEGANGLFYWSLGVNALAYVCKGWCDERVDYFERLKAVLNELKSLEPALTSVDRPDLLLSNSNPAAIRTRVKYSGGKAYLIGSNYSGQPASASFVWAGAVTSVSVYNEARQLPVAASSFSDSFGPYEARVYVIQ